MSSRRYDLFVTPEEMQEWLEEIATKFDLHLILRALTGAPKMELATDFSLKMRDGRPAFMAYLAAQMPTVDMMDPMSMNVIKFGWVSVRLPEVVGNVLIDSDFGSKSDWYDEADQKHENEEPHRILGRIKRLLGKRPHRPMWVMGPGPDTDPVAYREYACTDGAIAWIENGGQLKDLAATAPHHWVPDPDKYG